MPVSVGYQNGAWSISPTQTVMHGQGAIVFQRAQGQSWSFVSINGVPSGSPPTGWNQVVAGNGGILTLQDPHSSIANYPYTITINDGGVERVSPAGGVTATDPPIIMNEV
ncbi:MAG: hypothetical protein H7247_12785 [Polaromonas sp.]|nr:hypothetical protein [Gemmatimonadaceae bacterium]